MKTHKQNKLCDKCQGRLNTMPQRPLIANNTCRKTHNAALNTQLHSSLTFTYSFTSKFFLLSPIYSLKTSKKHVKTAKFDPPNHYPHHHTSIIQPNNHTSTCLNAIFSSNINKHTHQHT